MASCVPGELIRCAFVWHDLRNYPMLQKSPSELSEIEICNYRIGASVLLNRCCVFRPDLESIFLAKLLKIVLQHGVIPEIVPHEGTANQLSRNA